MQRVDAKIGMAVEVNLRGHKVNGRITKIENIRPRVTVRLDDGQEVSVSVRDVAPKEGR